MNSGPPSSPTSLPQRVGAAVVVTVLGVGVTSLVVDGFATAPLLRLLQGVTLFGLGTLVVIAAVGLVAARLGGWREPEADFERLVEHSERLARWPVTGEDTFEFGVPGAADGLEVAADDEAFDALVRAAIDELPLEFHRALEHVAIVVSDSGAAALRGRPGRRRGAYGMYQGDTVAHDFFTERILIFRDTLTRDFGHDPELLRSQVRRTVRHELAHHLGWGERGVRNLGL
jgi:predicted Zn-dependent protease with MMP-like domain